MNGLNRAAARFAAFSGVLAFIVSVQADEPTALRLVKEGNRYVGEQSKDKLVQIRSEKSVVGLVPNTWHVVFYDPTASFKAVEVKFEDGKMVEVKRPMRLLEPITGDDKVLDRDKIKIDSDKALANATKDPALDRITLRASKMWLQRGEGDQGMVWRIQLWAAKYRNPGDEADIGSLYISATDGRVLKNDLHPEKLE